MKKKIMKILSITIVAIMLAACGNTDSKVDQVIQNQMQEGDNKNSQSEQIKEIVEDKSSETTEKLQMETEADDITEGNAINGNVDVDLTKLSSTMVYSEVYNMMYTPQDYIGKTVKMSGTFVAYTNQDGSKYYPAIIIADATACCSQGLEFVLKGNPSYPDGYPEMETEITVVGTFETYEEDGNMYCRLQNAKVE